MVSHELRTPPQRIQFNTERLREATDDAAREPALHHIDRDVEELDELLTELLTYVRLGEPRKPERTLVDVDDVLGELCETMANGKIDLVLRPSRGDGAWTSAPVDSRLLRQAASNLIANAMTFAQSRIEVSLAEEGDLLCVHVDDDGPGIPAEARERVFEPFHTLAPEREAGRKHFGLGLKIVRRVAELHGGRAEALPSALGGARLRLELVRRRGTL